MIPSILVIDDQFGKIEALQKQFQRDIRNDGAEPRYNITFCSGQVDGQNSLDHVLDTVKRRWPPQRGEHYWALVLLDVRFDSRPSLPDDSTFGMRILAALRADPETRDIAVVMLTDQEGKRLSAGYARANGFLPKGELGHETLDERVRRHALIEDQRSESRLVGRSLPLLKALHEARLFALEPLGNAVIFGESGTGKTELARYVHDLSGRRGRFVKWTAEAKHSDIAKTELLGHWYGAHDHADNSAPGDIEKAHNGTFFLDEVAYLTPDIQSLLIDVRRRDDHDRGLRTIRRMGSMPNRHNRYERLGQAISSVLGEPETELLNGARQPTGRIKVDVLFITATNVDLWDPEIRDQRQFRSDLLADLGQRIVMPSLNEQRADIPALFRHLVDQAVARLRRSGSRSSIHTDPAVDQLLMSLDWTDRNVVALKTIAEMSVSRLGPDFHVISEGVVEEVVSGMLRERRVAGPDSRTAGGPPPPPSSPPQIPGRDESMTLDALITHINALELPRDQEILRGKLPDLQEAYARLVLRVFGAALRATRQASGTKTLEAIRLLLGRATLRADNKGELTKAYDVVLRLIALGDTKFEHRGGKNSPILSDDETVKAHAREAVEARSRSK